MSSVIFAVLAITFAVSASPAATRDEIRASLIRSADGTYRKLTSAEPAYGCRELFTSMLAYAEANTNLTRIGEILTFAEAMQDTDPESRSFGNFRWYSRDTAVMDYNAVDFCMQHGALLWTFHRERLEPDVRERFRAVLDRGLRGLVSHRVRETYTNIAILNATDLILLGEALGDAAAVREGERRLTAFTRTIFDDGVTFTRSPSMSLTDLYISLTSANRCPRPRETTCGCRFVYCPPGISKR
jgi:hypothetical protein